MFFSKRSIIGFLKASFLPLGVFLAVFLLMAFLGQSQASLDQRNYVSLPSVLLPQPIASFGAAASDHWLYVYGGHTGRTHQHSTENVSGAFFRLNLLDQALWEQLPGGPAVQSVSLVAHRGRIYRIGGMTARNQPGEAEDLHSVADFARYDPLAQRWEELASLPEPRSSHDAALLGDKLYVIGGWRLKGREKEWHKTAYVIDLASPNPRWAPITAPPFERRALAVVAADHTLYVLGGMDREEGISQSVDVYDTRTGLWSKGPDLPDNGFGVAATFLQDRLYASGMEGDLYRLSETQDRWERVETLAFPRYFHRLVPVEKNQLAAVGGAAPGGHLRTIEWIHLTREVTLPQISSWIFPFPGGAKNRQGIFLHNEHLYVFGGNNSLEQHDFAPHNFVSQAFKIHLGSFRVTALPDLPVKRQSLQARVLDGKSPVAYGVGGFGHDGEKARSFADVFGYDISKNQWETLQNRLPHPRSQFGLVERGGTLWIFGGLDYDPARQKDAFQFPPEVLSWNPREAQAGFVPTQHQLPRPRRAFGGTLLGDRYYLVGGLRENFQLVEECDVFDFNSGKWETIPAPSQPRISPELVALNGKLYLAGGSSPTAGKSFQPNFSIEVYDPENRRWSILTDTLPVSPRHIHMLALRDRLLIYSANHEKAEAMNLLIVDPE